MAARIVANATPLVEFLTGLELPLSKPQFRHFVNLVDALLVWEGRKTVSRLTRCLWQGRTVYSVCDFVRRSPWQSAAVSQRLRCSLLTWALLRDPAAEIWVSVDDTNAPKHKDSQALEGAGWHYNHTTGRSTYGYVLVTLHVTVGRCSLAIAFRVYLRDETVRKLNRGRPRDQRLVFASKLDLVQDMLTELKPFLPTDRRVYVLFDSWYASQELIRFCRQQHWQVICALRSNRSFNGKPLQQVRFRNHEYRETKVHGYSANSPSSSTTYLACAQRGTVRGLGDVRVVFSKRNQRSKGRQYFLCTDLSLRTSGILNRYAHRYQIERDYLYLKDRLGAADFRQRSLTAITKYLTLCFVALAYLQWRQAEEEQAQTLAELIADHRQAHLRAYVTWLCRLALRHRAVEPALAEAGFAVT